MVKARRYLAVAATSSLAVVASAISPPTSQAIEQPLRPVSSDAVPTPSHPADVKAYAAAGAASSQGLTPSQAAAMLDKQASFSQAVDRLTAGMPEVFSGAAWDAKTATGRVVLLDSTSSNQRASALTLMQKTAAKVDFTGRLTSAQLSQQASDIADELHSSSRVRTLSVTPGTDGRTIRVMSDTDYSTAIAAWSQRRARSSAPAAEVHVHVDPSLRSEAQVEVVGGADLQFPNYGGDACTAAFTVIYSTGQRGLLTAGHCPDDMNYGNNAGWLLTGWGGRSDMGDLQWHRTSRVTAPWFVWSRGQTTTVKDVRGLHSGFVLNRYGRYSQDAGLSIDAADSDETLSGQRYKHMAVTWSGCTSRPGDSGGPYWIWVQGGAGAAGIHTGSMTTLTTRRCVLTPASRVNESWFGQMWIQTG